MNEENLQPRDEGHAADRWKFDDEVTRVFDDMLARSIPQYDVMRKTVFDLACEFVRPKTDVVDLGCSRGAALAPLVDKFGAYNRFVGVEVSPPMLAACRQRFEGMISAGIVDVRDMDLRREYPPCRASVTQAVLTIQFTPIEHRQRILSDVFEHTVPGGAFVLVEKVLANTANLDRLMVKRYYGLKSDAGYSEDEIQRKRMSLEGVLVPVTAKWNEELLERAGFRQIDCFWRWMNFAGWIAVKD